MFSAGTWTYKTSPGGSAQTISLGQAGDIPVPADYDGDGMTDAAVFRPSNSTWYIRQSSTTNTVSVAFGTGGDIPVPGNYDGDGSADIAVFRPSTGDWWINGSTAGVFAHNWGLASDIQVPADYDGDGKTDIAVFRPSTAAWYVLKSSSSFTTYDTQVWGSYADQPVPADYDGDGKADFAIWRPATGAWHIKKSISAGTEVYGMGIGGDTAVSSAFIKQIGANVPTYPLARERLSPRNSTGGTDLYSQNFGWGTSLVGLPGRAGLDMGFGLSYNSLVWTKEGGTMHFDTNMDNVSPGFRLGFPVVEPAYFVPGTLMTDPYWTYVMVTPSGSRIEFKQVGMTENFETADSSYLRLSAKVAPDPNEPLEDISLTMRGTDGSQTEYEWIGGAYRATRILDRNGNYITVEYGEAGQLETVIDTLGREVNVNYDNDLYPISVTQTWKTNNGSGSNTTHTWAEFGYTTVTVNTDFDGLTVAGPPNSWTLKVLDKVEYADGSYTKFHHNPYVQVWKIENHAANNDLLSSVRNDLQTPAADQTDVPRFSATWSKTANFNLDGYGVPQEIKTEITRTPSSGFSLPGGLTGTGTLIEVEMDGHPYEAVTRMWFGETGWLEGLPLATEDHAKPTVGESSARQRWSWTEWTQDDDQADHRINPRITETRIGDSASTRKTEIDYLLYPTTDISQYGLVSEVRVYDSDLSTILKKQQTEYNLDSAYVNRRIIGLPSEVRLKDGSDTLWSKTTYAYDEEDFEEEANQIIAPIQHDITNYSDAFIIGRGNLTSVTRHDVLSESSPVTSRIRYDIAGSVVTRLDPLDRKVRLEYTDVFNDSSTPGTFAYPTKIYDPASNFSTVKYRFDIGANIEAVSPAPAGQSYGKTSKRIFDSIGRLQRDSIYINTTEHSYVRYEYPTNGIHSKVYSTPTDTDNDGADADDEVLSESWTDGAGRVRFSRVPHTFSSGTPASWAGTVTEYDVLGRVTRQSVPTEVDNTFTPTGDDSAFLWTHQKYDWMGRVIRKINTDGVDSPTLNDSDILISYEGCGCAGGQIITAWSEMVPTDDDPQTSARRGKRVYSDILGRNYKIENLNWTAGVYSTTMTTFNCRDQATRIREHEGAWTNPRYQTTSFTYDGHGRMASKHTPQQDPSASTQYTYYADDKTATITDGRGALTEYTYNSQGLVSEVEYSEPVGDTDSVEVIVPCNPSDPNCEYPYPSPTPIPTPSSTPTPLPSPTPQATPATIAVTYTYDALGNRTTMTDTEGNTAYEYDELSRLIAETRQFEDTLIHAPLSNNRFKLQYEYNLSGILKSITDPYGDTINYSYDKTGKLEDVTGTTFGGITNYASSSGYRAWGGLKGLSYGNGVDMTMSFDNRLRPISYELKKNTTDILKKDYEYYADGNIKYIEDLLDGKFDRLNIYDHQGRIKEAKSGGEARGETVDPEDREMQLPYQQSYEYNQYNNMTQRNNLHWGIDSWYGQTNNLDYAYYNNRVANIWWRHDKDGRVTVSSWPENYSDMTYDARGLLSRMTGVQGHGESDIHRYYDGDGREVKRTKQTFVEDPQTYPTWPHGEWEDDPNQYFIRSRVLGGQVITETWPTGAKKKTFVFAAGVKLATQSQYGYENTTAKSVYWYHADASGMSHRSTRNDGTIGYGDGQFDGSPAETDPMGNNMGIYTPYIEWQFPQPPEENFPYFPLDGDSPMYVNGQQVSCELDGMSVGCSMAIRMLESGSAIPSALAHLQGQPGFRFENVGLGIFRWHPPDNPVGGIPSTIYGYNSNNGPPDITVDSLGGGWRYFFFGRSDLGNDGPGLSRYPKRKLTNEEKATLKEKISSMTVDKTCLSKLNAVINALGSKYANFNDYFADVLNDKKGYKLRVTKDPINNGTSASALGGLITLNSIMSMDDHGIDTIHEMFHAVNKKGFLHMRVAQAIANVEGLNFENLKNWYKEHPPETDDPGGGLLNSFVEQYCAGGSKTWPGWMERFK